MHENSYCFVEESRSTLGKIEDFFFWSGQKRQNTLFFASGGVCTPPLTPLPSLAPAKALAAALQSSASAVPPGFVPPRPGPRGSKLLDLMGKPAYPSRSLRNSACSRLLRDYCRCLSYKAALRSDLALRRTLQSKSQGCRLAGALWAVQKGCVIRPRGHRAGAPSALLLPPRSECSAPRSNPLRSGDDVSAPAQAPPLKRHPASFSATTRFAKLTRPRRCGKMARPPPFFPRCALFFF